MNCYERGGNKPESVHFPSERDKLQFTGWGGQPLLSVPRAAHIAQKSRKPVINGVEVVRGEPQRN